MLATGQYMSDSWLEGSSQPRQLTVLEGTLAKFSSFLLELLNCSLIDTTALVDQVAGRGGLAGVDVTDDCGVSTKPGQRSQRACTRS